MRLVECVPNFSEGRDQKIIDAIAESIRSVEGARLLDVDPGKATNRTVFTLVGPPEVVLVAAFNAIARAAQLIDMRQHQGAHPRMGATDVCPFIPVSGISMQECAELAKRLGQRVADELGIPVYLYAEAAQRPERISLADIRAGEYEALPEKLKDPSFAPDFGKAEFNERSGATVIGARQFLIAYNVNLNTRSQKLAHEIALNIREAGRSRRDEQGQIVRDENGKPLTAPGTLKACRAVGWYIEEYQRAQVSINLIDYKVTSMHQAFDEISRQADKFGLRVTGSEIVGLVPLEPMLEAGRYYLQKQGRSSAVPDKELISMAVQSLGLSDLSAFEPHKKIIEYTIADDSAWLRNQTLSDFLDELSSESPAPGGGSVAALAGGLSAALGSMVANLTYDKKGFESSRPEMTEIGQRCQALKSAFLQAVDDDTRAFNAILEARRLPKSSPADKDIRNKALAQANYEATLVPLNVLKLSVEALELAAAVTEKGNPNSLSDSGVAVWCARTAAEAAYYNVLINLSGLEQLEADDIPKQADQLINKIRSQSDNVTTSIENRLKGT